MEGSLNGLRLENPDEWVVESTSSGYQLHRVERDIRGVHIEPTTRCNLSCKNCVRNTWEESLEDMSQATFDRIMMSLAGLPDLVEVHFGGFGEPLLHPDLLDMVDRVKSLGVRASLITNGILLDEKVASALLESGLDRLFVSVDSANPGLFGESRDGAELDQVIENLRRIKNMRDERGLRIPTIGLEAVITKSNAHDIKHLPSVAKEVGASKILLSHLLPHSERATDQIAYGDNGVDLDRLEGWPILAGGYVMWGILSAPRNRWGASRSCRFINEKKLVIRWDGRVSPCYGLLHSYPYYIFGDRKVVTSYTLGDVNTSSLSDIWTSEEYILFRSRVTDFRFPSCVDCGANCDFRERNEDCWVEGPSCADCLWAQDIVRCP